MPLYEYRCDKCGDVFEIVQKFADEPLSIHENCGGPVHRLLSAPALQFKGSGWYVNDYAKGGSSSSGGSGKKDEAAGKPAASSSESSSSSNGSSDTKTSDTKTSETKAKS